MKRNGIVVAIDVNDYEQDVLDLAAQFAKHYGLELDVLYISLFPDPNNAAWPAYLGSPNALIADHRKLKAITTNVSDVKLRRHHLSGIPVQKILEYVDRNEPRLLVVGTHGRRGVQRLLGNRHNL